MFKHILITLALMSGLISLQVQAQIIDTVAKNALLMDAETGTILLDKNSDQSFPPASMSKLMTIYMAFDQIKQGQASLQDEITITNDQWRRWRALYKNEGSTMFLGVDDTVTLEDLLRGVIVLSGNDASIAIAEHLAGDEAAFAAWMNEKAIEIGLKDSHFVNSTGWPADGHEMSARDLAHLSYLLVTKFPDLYSMFGESSFLYKNLTGNQHNRNPLLGTFDGADGLKTGHTKEALYCLAASAQRDGRRLILVLAGLASESERSRESQRLMGVGFRMFDNYHLFQAGETVDHADVWLGERTTIPLVIENSQALTLSKRQRSSLEVTVNYSSPIPAPIVKGQPIATMTITASDMEPKIVELVAGEDIAAVSGFGKLSAAIEYMLFGSVPAPAPAPVE